MSTPRHTVPGVHIAPARQPSKVSQVSQAHKSETPRPFDEGSAALRETDMQNVQQSFDAGNGMCEGLT